jgi:L-rhamnose mutarotase
MKWVRRIVFSLAALASIFAGVYFSFLVESPNESLTGIWLAFAILMLALAWPEIVKSVNFVGNSIEFRELESEVKKLSNLMKSYWTELRNENDKAQKEYGFAIDIDTNASFLSLDKNLDDQLDSTENIAETIAKRLNGLWPEVLGLLKKHGIETTTIESIPYYENPLFNPEWEYINIGIPNSFVHLRQMLTQLALKHYESLTESGAQLSEDEQERLEILQQRLKRYAGNVLVD